MGYKNIVKSKKTRLRILKLLDFIPDNLMIKIQYKLQTGRKLNLKNPKRFNEKINWYKINYRDKKMIDCSDKYLVREFVKKKGLEDILVPLYGVYENANSIDFLALPSKFVLKVNNGSQTNILCEDKLKLDFIETKNKLNEWMIKRSSKLGREWAYYDIEPKIICEKYLEKDKENDLKDFKFFCFNGIPEYLYVLEDRSKNGSLKCSLYDMEFNKLPYRRIDIDTTEDILIKPENFEKMVEIAKTLSSDFPHVRVDLYNIDGEIYFGELTFYNGSGYKDYVPDSFNFEVGEKFILPEKRSEL